MISEGIAMVGMGLTVFVVFAFLMFGAYGLIFTVKLAADPKDSSIIDPLPEDDFDSTNK